MLIDWFTVIAQLLNFLVLIWLLKRFLYHPILDAIDAREKRIASQLADAEDKRAQATQERTEFEEKNMAFDKQQTERMNQATKEVAAERQRLLDAARVESEQLRHKLYAAVKNEQQSLQQALSQQVQDEVFAIAGKVLGDLADTSLETCIIAVFIDRLQTLDNQERNALKSVFVSSTQPLLVRTAFPLTQEQCSLIETTLYELIGDTKQLQFVTKADLVSGIDIYSNGQKISWNIAEYLASFTKHIDTLLQSPSNFDDPAVSRDFTKTQQVSDENQT